MDGALILEAVKGKNGIRNKALAELSAKSGKAHLASECPLAGDHLAQVIERMGEIEGPAPDSKHPIELFAKAYGLV